MVKTRSSSIVCVAFNFTSLPLNLCSSALEVQAPFFYIHTSVWGQSSAWCEISHYFTVRRHIFDMTANLPPVHIKSQKRIIKLLQLVCANSWWAGAHLNHVCPEKINNKICLQAAPPPPFSFCKQARRRPTCLWRLSCPWYWSPNRLFKKPELTQPSERSSVLEAYYRSSCCRRYLLDLITMLLSTLKKPCLTLTSRPAYQLGRSSNEGLISVNGGKKWGRTSNYRSDSGLVLFLTWKHHANPLDWVLIYCLWCQIVN